MGYSPWGPKELDMTEQLYLLTYCVSVSGSLGIVELNKIHALRKLEICEWATQIP